MQGSQDAYLRTRSRAGTVSNEGLLDSTTFLAVIGKIQLSYLSTEHIEINNCNAIFIEMLN